MKIALPPIEVDQPSIDDYSEFFPKMPCNTEQKQKLFNLITKPDTIHRAIVFVEETGKSPITVIENKIQIAINKGKIGELTPHEKQFVGAVACVVMEKNKFKRTGHKQRYSKGIFSSAEIYS